MYAYGRFMLMYGRDHHNVVIILQLKLILERKGKKIAVVCLCQRSA